MGPFLSTCLTRRVPGGGRGRGRPVGLGRPCWLQALLTAVVLSPAGPRQLHGAADGPGREPERPQPPPAGRTPSRQKVCPAPFPGVAGVSLAPKPSTIRAVGRQSGHVRGSLGFPVAGWGHQPGGISCGSHVTTGVPRPGRASLTAALEAGLWLPVTTSCLKVCALVTQCTSLLETQTSRSDWSHFGHFPYPQLPGHANMGRVCGAQ